MSVTTKKLKANERGPVRCNRAYNSRVKGKVFALDILFAANRIIPLRSSYVERITKISSEIPLINSLLVFQLVYIETPLSSYLEFYKRSTNVFSKLFGMIKAARYLKGILILP